MIPTLQLLWLDDFICRDIVWSPRNMNTHKVHGVIEAVWCGRKIPLIMKEWERKRARVRTVYCLYTQSAASFTNSVPLMSRHQKALSDLTMSHLVLMILTMIAAMMAPQDQHRHLVMDPHVTVSMSSTVAILGMGLIKMPTSVRKQKDCMIGNCGC